MSEVSPVTAPRPVTSKDGGGTAPGYVPPQMQDLSFLIGRFRCCYTASTPLAPDEEPTILYMSSSWTLNGNYVSQSQYATPTGLRATAVYGWNPVDQRFFAQYHDTWGSNGTEVSAGRWQNGHLIFTGPVLLVTAPSATGEAEGLMLTVKDDFTVSESGYILFQEYILPDGTAHHGSYDCRRI